MFSKPAISPKTLGLDIRNDVIHAVLASVSGDEFTIIQTYSEPVPEAAVPRDAQRDVLKAMVAKHRLKGVKTVLSSSSDEPMGSFAEVMPEGRGIDTNQWALTQLEAKLNGTGGVYIADASVSRVPGQRIVSYLKRGEFESRMSMVRDAGLVPLAFDAPILAWQRRLGKHFGENADGLLDLDGRPTLYLFKEPVGYVKSLSATDDMNVLAREISQYLRERRRNDHDLTINALYVHGPGNVSDIMMELSAQDRAIELHHLSIPTAENPKDDPPWAFASALATWDVPGALGMRANLINADKRGVSAFGRRFGKGDIVPGVAAVLAAVVVVAATEVGFSSAVAGVNANDNSVNAQVATEEIQAKRVAVIQTAVERLRTIDRDRFWLERSGRIVALRMVDLANAIPQEASISRMSHDRSGWRVEGGGGDLGRVAQTQDNLEKASPGQTVMMLDETHASGAYGFQMTITGDPTALAPAPTTQNGAVR